MASDTTKFNRIVFIIICIIITILFTSCVNSDKEVPCRVDYNKTHRGSTIQTFDYEGCEYIVTYEKMAHKGNCKNKIHYYDTRTN